ncbi:MAG TPA: hypothetical protein VGC90_03330 [Candidatus Limnocylindrales bacterium]
MHTAPAAFRSIRNAGLTLRFAVLGPVAYVLAEVPAAGSRGTALEEACERPHWGFVVDGTVALEGPDRQWSIPAGSAFHVPPNLRHAFRTTGAARIAGFAALDRNQDFTDEGLAAAGYDVVSGRAGAQPRAVVPRVGSGQPPAQRGEVATHATLMGDVVMCQTRFGPRSGFTSRFCDLEHWGLVTAGSMAIESEEDVEVVTAGDVFYCPPGPPGHRFTAADAAASIDFTPVAAFERGGRVVPWRAEVAASLEGRRRRRPAVEIAALR